MQNFNIRAIVQLGAKTFGETGTNTVVLFLEKFDEPPKRIELVEDSITAIFDNADLSGWEDEMILKEYLLKINVSLENYKDFVTQKRIYTHWEDDVYFGKYLLAFLLTAEVINKQKQKSFKKLSIAKQIQWYNQHFFDFVRKREIEKIRYFALVYHQTTLIVTSPNDNKEQEQFLGYKWSGRKGQEGIREILRGGKLYNPNDRTDENTIAGIVRNMFYEKKIMINHLNNYYYYLRTQDMLDFSSVTFNKSIKTVKTRTVKNSVDLKTYQLSDKKCFEVSIGNRVLSTEIEPNGQIPIFSANVFQEFGRINKQNLTDFSIPSVLWGIDGDWMVNYIPENHPFYPTDHCGVLRIKTKDIFPQYMAFALQVEGEYEQFSRSNRASIQKIESLTFQIPKLSVQQQIVDEVTAVDKKIKVQSEKIKKYSENIKFKFIEMFGGKEFKCMPLEKLYDFQLGKTPSRNNYKYWENPDYKWISVSDMGNYDRYTNNTQESISQLAIQETGIKIVPVNTVIMSFKLTIGRTAITSEDIYTNEAIIAFLSKKIEYISLDYLRIYLSIYDWTDGKINAVKGITLNKKSIGKAIITIPPKKLQDEFDVYIETMDKLKSEAQDHKKKLMAEKSALLDKYFK